MTIEEIIFSTIQMLIALILGFSIGFERKMRYKEAGIRTHTIVCIGSCLYMIISTYITKIYGVGDPARIAAQIVSGIGFIGAGMIFHHRQVVHGLTTAAGIWATAAIGMAVGAGMLVFSVIASVIIISVQFIMHLPFKLFHSKNLLRLNVVFTCTDGTEKNKVMNLFGISRFTKISAKKEAGQLVYNTLVITDKDFTADDIYKTMTNNDFIISINREYDEA